MRIALDQVVAPLLQVEEVQIFLGPCLLPVAVGVVRVEAGDKAQVFSAGQFFVEIGPVRDIAGQLPADPGLGHQRMTADRRAAAGGQQQAGDDLDGGGFAGTVGPEKTENLPGAHPQVDAVDGRQAVELFAQLVQDQDVLGHG